jgi:hypothetical protein
LKRATDNAKKEYLESICDEIIEFQRTGTYDLMHTKTGELGWKENHGMQNIRTEDSQGNIMIDQRRVLQILQNCITELYDRANRPEHLEFEPEDEEDEDEKDTYILQSEDDKALKEMRDKKATGVDDVAGDVLKCLGEDVLRLIALKKKPKAAKRSNHLTISIIADAAKIVARKIRRRIERKTEDALGEDQFGFRRGKGTRDAIGMMRIISERTLVIDEELCACS